MKADSDTKIPAVFFDRDGVVNESPQEKYYVLSWDDFEFRPGIFDAFEFVKKSGALAILVTSQKGVGKGLMSGADLEEIHSRMQEAFRNATGYELDGIYAYTGTLDCPHQPKPDPEMILTAAKDLNIDLSRSWMIGDADRDIEMGKAAGLARTIRVKTEKPIGIDADETVDDLFQTTRILEREF